MSKTKKDTPIVAICILGVLLAIILAVVIMIFNSNETYISDNETPIEQELLQCTSSSPFNPFFNTNKNTSSTNYIIKYIYEDGEVQSVSLIYSATFETEEIAKAELASMMSEYYQYTAKNHIDDSNKVFNRQGKDISITLYFDKSALSSTTNDLLFLNNGGAGKISKYPLKDLKKIYQNKNFSCENNKFNS